MANTLVPDPVDLPGRKNMNPPPNLPPHIHSGHTSGHGPVGLPGRPNLGNHPPAPTPDPTPTPSPPPPPPDPSTATSGKDLITAFLSMYGLQDLTDWAWNLYTGKADGVVHTIDEISALLPFQQAFKDRFPAYEQLAKDGRGISANDYVAYETTVRQSLKAYGIPSGLWDTKDGIAKLLLADVAAPEVQQRLSIASDAAYNAPAEVRQALTSMFGVDMGQLTAYYLDPDLAVTKLQQQFHTAQVAGAAASQGFQADESLAERLAAQGFDYGSARQGFGQAAQMADVTNQLFGQTDSINQDTLVSGVFGDAAAAKKTRDIAAARTASYSGAGGAAATQGGVSGLGSANR